MSIISSAPAAHLLLAAVLIASADGALGQGDDCASASAITGVGTFAFNNAANTTSSFSGGTCTSSIQRDVFWSWTAPAAGDYQFDTFGTSFDTNMSVHAGGDCNANCLGSNNDVGQQLQSQVQVLGVQAGDELLIQVGSFLLFAGAGQMNVSQIGDPCAGLGEDGFEPNDSCANRHVLSPGVHTDLFVTHNDPDYFGVLVQPGERLEVSVVAQNPGDVDLVLFDSGCSWITADGVSVGYTHVGNTPGILVVGASLDNSGSQVPCAQYDLDIQVSDDPCLGLADDAYEDHDSCNTALRLSNGTYTGFHVNLWDKDFLEFCVPAGSTVNVDALFPHALGDVDMFLLADWSFPCGIGPAGTTLAEGTSINDNESLSWTNNGNQSQRCYLEISMWHLSDSSCNDYDLVISGVEHCFLGSEFCGPAPDNSAGHPGVVTARGSTNVADNHVVLVASNLPDGVFGYFLVSQGQGVLNNPAGSWGHLCLAGAHPIGRLNDTASIGFTQGGRFEVPIDLTRLPEPPGYTAVQAGETWNFQAWHRDNVGGQPGSNFTNALAIPFN